MRFPALQLSVALCVGIGVIYAVFLAHHALLREHLVAEQTEARDRLDLISDTLSQALNVRLNHTRSLAAFVEVNRYFTQDEFDRFANSLRKDQTGLRSLQLAPNGVVTYVTDIEDNRGALGHNLFSDPKRRHLVEKAVDERRYIVAGPIDLIQGGKAIIARLPIFLPNGPEEEDTFWGFATVLIDVFPLLLEADYFELEKRFDLSIRGKDGRGRHGEVFYGDSATFLNPLATSDVLLAEGTWQIGAVAKAGHTHEGYYTSIWYWIGGVSISFCMALAAYVIADQPVRLRKAVRQATSELVVARDQAEAASRTKSEFIAAVSHELRTPLTSIKGGLGLLELQIAGSLKRDTKTLLDIAQRNCTRLESFIGELLDAQKIEAGEMLFQFQALSATSLLHSAIEEYRGYGATHGVSFELEGEFDESLITGDEGRLMQVFANLMSNAAKFSPAGSVVKLSAIRRNDMLRFTVKDSGTGIDEAFRNRVFDRFSQQEGADNRRAGGTGLGLNIARTIVEKHGGVIGFEDNEDVGTTFFFELPIKEQGKQRTVVAA